MYNLSLCPIFAFIPTSADPESTPVKLTGRQVFISESKFQAAETRGPVRDHSLRTFLDPGYRDNRASLKKQVDSLGPARRSDKYPSHSNLPLNLFACFYTTITPPLPSAKRKGINSMHNENKALALTLLSFSAPLDRSGPPTEEVSPFPAGVPLGHTFSFFFPCNVHSHLPCA